MNYGLLGQKLSHSYSPLIHKTFGDYVYSLFETEPENLSDFLSTSDFTGINVTMPYKKSVIPFCASLSETARKLGAVNTIIRDNDGKLHGYNTDYFGFQFMLSKSGLNVSGKKVLVLGSGGASVTVSTVLKELGAVAVVISRSGENNYMNLHLHRDAAIIVNTTPVGMYPNVGISPIDLSMFQALEGVLDVIYNPMRTQLIMDAQNRGIITMNGLWMLVAQAKESAELFSNHKLGDDLIEAAHYNLLSKMKNLILVGMPGSGKTTIGRELARALQRTFIDIDDIIEKESGLPVHDFITQFGEEKFREVENIAISKYGKKSSLIISTGGGCVTQAQNYSHLHQNGTIIWVTRDICKLSTTNRPLSQPGKLENMYQLRKPMYENFADYSIDNNQTPQDSVRQILAQEAEI